MPHHVPPGLLRLPPGAPAGFKALLSPNGNECWVSALRASIVDVFRSDPGYSPEDTL